MNAHHEPVDLSAALSTFDQPWSPRIVTHMNDYDVRVAKFHGTHLWHTHDDTDELFLVLAGEATIALRGDGSGAEPGGERTVTLTKGSVFVVPRGVEHKPSSPDGASVLLLEPTGTSTVGDRQGEEVPAQVDVTTGHRLD